jgi:hypothetical protein
MAEREINSDNLLAEYKEVCSNFRLLTDIRFKLLTVLPIGTAAGIWVAGLEDSKVSTSLVGLFGFVVTAGAALYNLRNDQLYNELVQRAAQLERLLGLKEGAFAQRPRPWRHLGPFTVEHEKIWWIYLSSLVAWLYTILIGLNTLLPHPLLRPLDGIVGLVLAVGVILLVAKLQNDQKNLIAEQLRTAAREATALLTSEKFTELLTSDQTFENFFEYVNVLAGKKSKARKREENEKEEEERDRDGKKKLLQFYLGENGDFYWDRPPAGQRCDARAAAQLLSLLCDLPARWIFDISSGRKGELPRNQPRAVRNSSSTGPG